MVRRVRVDVPGVPFCSGGYTVHWPVEKTLVDCPGRFTAGKPRLQRVSNVRDGPSAPMRTSNRVPSGATVTRMNWPPAGSVLAISAGSVFSAAGVAAFL